MKKTTASLRLSLLAATLIAAFNVHAADQAISQNRLDLGKVDAVIGSLAQQFANPGITTDAQRTKTGNGLETAITHFYNKDGMVSISGRASDSINSTFFLKGTNTSLHGYLIKHDSKRAYEYSTDANGQVSVTEIAIANVVPDYHPDWEKAHAKASLATLAAIHPSYSSMANRQAVHIGPYNNEDVTTLQSKPGSPWVFYLNTTAVMSGSTPLNGVTKENMYRAWQVTADQYSMFQLNITTNRAVYDAARAANPLRTGIINFVNADGRSNAPVGSFGTTSAGTLYRNPSSGFDYGYGIGMTCAHEVGHQMGMLHDHGGTGGEYFEGLPAFQWGPIMGNYWFGSGWANSRWTWSKGEYNTASNFEDDLRIMNVTEAVPYVADDNPSGKPLVVSGTGAISPSTNWGQIEKTGDTDTFNFSVTGTGGKLDLRIDPIEYFGDLDVDAKIYNSAGSVVASVNKQAVRNAEFVAVNLPAGDYRLVISGGAEGTPQNGFSNYSSLGYYAMQGTLTGAITPPGDIVLANGVGSAPQAASSGMTYYILDVPAGQSKVVFETNGTNGNANLYAQMGTKPTTSSYTCKSDGASSIEACTINTPAAGRYYLGVNASSAYSGLTVKATYSYVPPGDVMLTSGVGLPNQSGAVGSMQYYAIDVPAGKTKVTFAVNGASGDVDLFARMTTKPTTTSYTCKSDGPTAIETCSINTPAAGRYYLGVYGYTAFSALTVKATVQ
ncbi:MAG: pre-peptidase C-terminal domain-containing protein [Undibacterium sp.]|nr:pre-peptidase C-terminal domain-containing protein [Undibacterium sp.]